MNLLSIAWRNVRHRWLASLLTMLSMALGVALTVMVLSISGIVYRSLEKNGNVGYNLIVGAKGSSTQLVFSSVYYLSAPIENLKYSYYMEFLPGDQRQAEYARLGGQLKDPDRPGLYSRYLGDGFAIPVCLGDYVGRFRAVGTTPQFFEWLKHGDRNDQAYEFRAGRNFVEESPEHGFFEAVVGSEVAQELGFQLGDQLFASHGSTGSSVHAQGFTIVGILKTTGTPTDRAAFLNIEGFFLLEDHAAPERNQESGLEIRGGAAGKAPEQAEPVRRRLPVDKREVTAILLRSSLAMGMQKSINKTEFAQAVSPVGEIGSLLQIYIRPLQWAMLTLTLLVCLVSAISILVSIYNSMNERTRDIAVMRALGASRDTVLAIILCEACWIAVVGGLVGWVTGHAIAAAASPWIESQTGVKIGFFSIHYPNELYIIPGLILVGVLAGLIPALVAYRTDVSKSLAT